MIIVQVQSFNIFFKFIDNAAMQQFGSIAFVALNDVINGEFLILFWVLVAY